MAWTDVKIELDKVKTAVDSLSTADGLTAKADTLDRTEALDMRKDCDALAVKLMDMRDRVKIEQEPTKKGAVRLLLEKMRLEKDYKELVMKADGNVTKREYSSVIIGRKIIQTPVYITDDGIKCRRSVTNIVEDL